MVTRVIIESPFATNKVTGTTVEEHIKYARRCVRDSVLRGEAPLASHLLFTQEGILDDLIPEQRKLGIEAGLAWRDVADKTIVYTDYGVSSGMAYAIEKAIQAEAIVEYRMIGRNT